MTANPELVDEAKAMLIASAKELGAPSARPHAELVRERAGIKLAKLNPSFAYADLKVALSQAAKELVSAGIFVELNTPVPTVALREL